MFVFFQYHMLISGSEGDGTTNVCIDDNVGYTARKDLF